MSNHRCKLIGKRLAFLIALERSTCRGQCERDSVQNLDLPIWICYQWASRIHARYYFSDGVWRIQKTFWPGKRAQGPQGYLRPTSIVSLIIITVASLVLSDQARANRQTAVLGWSRVDTSTDVTVCDVTARWSLNLNSQLLCRSRALGDKMHVVFDCPALTHIRIAQLILLFEYYKTVEEFMRQTPLGPSASTIRDVLMFYEISRGPFHTDWLCTST